jgi:hypothetical protein
MIHLANQIFVLGPSYMHYMYSYERYMVVMKGMYTIELILKVP